MPFIQTALIGDDSLEGILHFGALRFRVQGFGSLLISLDGLDNIRHQNLKPLEMVANPGVEQTSLANFSNQRASLNLSTDEIDDIMKVNKIIFFAKSLYTGLPG